MSTGENLTEDQASSRELTDADAHIRHVFMQAPVAIMVFKGPSFTVNLINDQALAMWKTTRKSVADNPFFDVFPLLQPALEPVFRQILEDSRPVNITEFPVTSVQNNVPSLLYFNLSLQPVTDAEGTVTGITCIGTDVTREIVTRKKVEESESKYRALFNSIDEGFCIIEVLFNDAGTAIDYRFLETNHSFERQTGLSNVTGKTIREMVPAHEDHWFEIYGRIAKTGEPERFENAAEEIGHYYDVYAFSIDRPEDHRVAVLFNDISARRLQEKKVALLAEIEKHLAQPVPLPDLLSMIGSLIGRHFNVARCTFAGFDEERGEATVTYDWHTEGLPGIPAGSGFPFGSRLPHEQQGPGMIVVNDTAAGMATGYVHAERGTRSFITSSVTREGRQEFLLTLADTRPGVWQNEEIALVQELTERIWSGLAKIKAEQALKENEIRLLQAMQAGHQFGWEINFSTRQVTYSGNQQAVLGFEPPLSYEERFLLIHPDDIGAAKEAYNRARDYGEPIDLVYRIVVPEGNGRVVWVHIQGGFFGNLHKFVGTTRNITAAKEAELFQAYLLKLSDTLRMLVNPADIQSEAMRVLGEHLGVVRALYWETELNDGHLVFSGGYATDGVPLHMQAGPDDFGPFVKESLRDGRTLAVADGLTDDRVSEAARAAYRQPGSRAFVGIPLVKNGRFAACITLHHATPRNWTSQELILAEETAERTWAAVERAKIEKELRESEAKLAAMFEVLPVGIGFMNIDGALTLFNKEMTRYLPAGIIPSAGQEHPAGSACHPDGTPVNPGDLPSSRALRGEHVVPGMELFYTGQNQEKTWTRVAAVPVKDPDGEIMGQVAIVTDITQLKQAAEALHKSTEAMEEDLRNTQLLHNLSERLVSENDLQVFYEEIVNTAIALTNSDAGTVQMLDEETQELVIIATRGFPEHVTRHFLRLDAGSNTSCGIALLTNERTFVDYDDPGAPDPDGSMKMHVDAGYRSAQSTPLVTRAGKPIGMVSTHWRGHRHRPSERELRFLDLLARQTADLLERKQREESYLLQLENDVQQRTAQVELQNAELQKMNKELEAFTYISSHDLQEPLRKIRTFAGRIIEKEQQHLSETAKDYFIRMQDAASRMQTLIQDLLSFSRLTTTEIKFESIPLGRIVEEVQAELKDAIKAKQARIETSGMCTVRMIPFQLSQLMHNLISNSLKFARPGIPPLITISSRVLTDRQPAGFHSKPVCHIVYTDNGIGFEPHFAEKIFELFQRLHSKEEFAGTGIGLAIVKKIVENHGGIITATGELNKGCRFDIYLPVNA